jgi:hypothetical protein
MLFGGAGALGGSSAPPPSLGRRRDGLARLIKQGWRVAPSRRIPQAPPQNRRCGRVPGIYGGVLRAQVAKPVRVMKPSLAHSPSL